VRFLKETPFRFIALVPAGKTADFMQLDVKDGYRQIPIGWGGKTKASSTSENRSRPDGPVFLDSRRRPPSS